MRCCAVRGSATSSPLSLTHTLSPSLLVSLFPPSVTTLNAEYPKEFAAFQKCLDYNDYRFNDCRKTERALLDSWNVKMGYAVAQSE